LAFVLAIEIPVVLWAFRRPGFLPFPHGIMAYIIGAQCVVWAVSVAAIEHRFQSIYSSYSFIDRYAELALGSMVFFFACAACAPNMKHNLAVIIRDIHVPKYIIYIGIIFLLLRTLLNMFVLDWDVAWHNRSYLLMGG